MISNDSLERIRTLMANEYGQENISRILMETAQFHMSKPKTFLEVIQYFATRYDIELKMKQR